MNAEEIIEEIIDTVDDDDYSDSEKILGYANQAQSIIAEKLYLPDLQSGQAAVDTVTDGFEVALPVDYSKGLYLVWVNSESIDIYGKLVDLVGNIGPLTLEIDDIKAVYAGKTTLIYQGIPEVVTSIDLFYYRQPVPMLESSNSYPDGDVGNDDFEWAIIHHACQKIFARIEDGIEGAKVNTMYHKSQYDEKMFNLEAANPGMHPTRPTSNRGWLGDR